MFLRFRDADLGDLDLLNKWDREVHVFVSDPNDSDWNWEEELVRNPSWRHQWIAEINNKPIGFIQIIDPQHEESQYWGPMPEGYRAIDIWIGESDFLGKGYGSQMMQYAIDFCFQDPDVHTILVDPLSSNTRAHRFYERLGFQWIRAQDFDGDYCYVYSLTRPSPK
jgi:aminoglycoside 6'-N-acetyltransferase